MQNQFGQNSASTMNSSRKQKLTQHQIKIALGQLEDRLISYDNQLKYEATKIRIVLQQKISSIKAKAQFQIQQMMEQAKQQAYKSHLKMKKRQRVDIEMRDKLKRLDEQYKEQSRQNQIKHIIDPQLNKQQFEYNKQLEMNWLMDQLEKQGIGFKGHSLNVSNQPDIKENDIPQKSSKSPIIEKKKTRSLAHKRA